MGTTGTRPKTAARLNLNRSRIVDAALAIVDREGLEAVTIRAVAAELGAAPMSLYRHVESKTQLYDLMLEHVVKTLAPPGPPHATWRTDLAEASRHARAVLRRHPEWIPLLRKLAPKAAASGIYARIGAGMNEEGLAASRKGDAIASLVAFTLGFVLVERLIAPPRAEASSASFAEGSLDRAYEFGLDALVAGMVPGVAAGTRRLSTD